MAGEPRLDRAKPFITVFGEAEYAFKQGNKCFDAFFKFLKYEGDEPKVADEMSEEERALRVKIRAEVEAEMKREPAEQVSNESPRMTAADFRKAKPT